MKRKSILALILATTMLMGSTLSVSADEVSFTEGQTEYDVSVDSSFEVPITDLSKVIVTIPADLSLNYDSASTSYKVDSSVSARGEIGYNCILSIGVQPSIEYTNTETGSTLIADNTYAGGPNNDVAGFAYWTSDELAVDGGVSKDFTISKAAADINETGTWDSDVAFNVKCHEIISEDALINIGLTAGGYRLSQSHITQFNTYALDNGGTYNFPAFVLDSEGNIDRITDIIGSTSNYSSSLGSVTKIVFPEGINYIKDTCSYLTNLEEVVLPSTLKTLDNTFYNNTSIETIDLPTGLEGIKASTFEGCTSLSNIAIPNTVEDIYNKAFKGCTSLTQIKIPDSVDTLYSNVFEGCTALESVYISKSLSSLGGSTFKDCTSLNTVDFSSSLSTIKSNDFLNCTSLSTVNYNGTSTQFKNITGLNYLTDSGNNSGNLTVHCTDGDLVYVDGVLQ